METTLYFLLSDDKNILCRMNMVYRNEKIMNNQVLIIDDLEAEGLKLQSSSRRYGIISIYIKEQDFRMKVNNEEFHTAVMIGHKKDFVVSNIEKIRRTSIIPIIAITYFKNIREKLRILDMGADDYLSLPFIEEELFAKARSMIRRTNLYASSAEINQSCMYIKDICLDSRYKTLYKNGQKIKLTKTEYKILFYLSENIGMILSSEQISCYVWKEYSPVSYNSIACQIHNLRKKLGSGGNEQKYIETIKGMGYRLRAD